MSDPNAWIDPLGLMGNKKDDRGLFWLSDSAQSKNQQELNKTYNTNPKNTKTNLEWMSSDNGYPRQPKVVSTPAPAPTQEIPRSIYVPQRQPSPGALGMLLPNTMAPLAKNQDLSRTLQSHGAIRNTNLGAVAVAGYGPYAVAATSEVGMAVAPHAIQVGRGAIESGKTVWANPTYQASLKTAGGSMGMDAGFQFKDMARCKCIQWDGSRTVIAGTMGAAGGLWGGAMANAAKVEFVGGTKVINAVKSSNWGGLTIYANQAMFQQAGTKIAGGVLSENDKKLTDKSSK